MSDQLSWPRIEADVRKLLFHVGAFSAAMSIIALAPAIYSLQIYDRVLNSRSVPTLVVLTIGILACLVFLALIDWTRTRVLGYYASRLDETLGPGVIRSVLESVVRPQSPSNAVSMRDVATLRQFLAGPGVMALFDAPWLVFYTLIMFVFHPVLGVELVVGSLLLIGLTWRSGKLAAPLIDTMQSHTRVASRFIDQGVRNADVLTAHGTIAGFVSHWMKKNALLLQAQNELTTTSARHAALGRFIRLALQSGMTGTAAALAIEGKATAGIMIASTLLLSRATQPLETLLAGWRQFLEARLSYARVAADFTQRDLQRDKLKLPEPSGRLEFDRVVYGHPGASKPAIRGLSFAVAAGELVAVIGPSGSGKSTAGRLACGLSIATAGAVRLDGADVSQWPYDELGQHIGYMPQASELLAGSIADNIARMGALDSDAVVKAAKDAGAHDFILGLPQGYDTLIGDGGAGLSGGETQRVALARALYGKPKLVILDEPNASLDRDGDLALLDALKNLKAARVTALVITHRPAMTDLVDKVLVIRDGSAVLYGPKDDVLPKLGVAR